MALVKKPTASLNADNFAPRSRAADDYRAVAKSVAILWA